MLGDKSALTKQQKDGLDFFNKKGECAECHSGPNFTTEKFANLGIGMDQVNPDPGRETVTKKRGDFGKFKVPTLRDLAHRTPYMHDGALKRWVRFWIYTRREGCPTLIWTLASHPFIWISKPSRICWLFSLRSTEKAGRKSPPPAVFPQ